MSEDGARFLVWNTSSEYAINSNFEEVGLVPKVVLGIRFEFLLLLEGHIGREDSRNQIICDIGIPGILLPLLRGYTVRMLDRTDRMNLCTGRMDVLQARTNCKELFIRK